MKRLISILFVILIFGTKSFPQSSKEGKAGTLSLGVRNNVGLVYEKKWNRMTFGTGGQFRLAFSDRVNSDWFIDFLQGDLDKVGKRSDVHIGWEILFYPVKQEHILQPYFLAGHCFELLKLSENGNLSNNASRRSASVQGGAGVHWHLTPRADISFVGQYMMHFGTKIDVIEQPEVRFVKQKGLSLQDHILIHISLNYKISDLW